MVVMKPLSTCQKCVNHNFRFVFHSERNNVKYQFVLFGVFFVMFLFMRLCRQFAWQVKEAPLNNETHKEQSRKKNYIQVEQQQY